MKRSRAVLLDTLKQSAAPAAAVALCLLGSAGIFFLYGLPPEPFGYAAAVIVAVGLVCFAVFYARQQIKAARREQALRSVLTKPDLPPADTLAQRDYAQAIRLLYDELVKRSNEYETLRQDEVDYYTAWVHQIKTPIAVVRMELGGDGGERALALEAELFRIEQYVDMVLQYIRLGSGSRDLVIRPYPLDDLIREAVRKYAPQFVSKRLRLDYGGTGRTVVTDKKWFGCMLEQILSNAIKYTSSGGITVTVEDGRLTVSDTGIGIAPEDLPRIFEKGYTGENGRLDKRASGLGLYLCKQTGDLLRIPVSVESTVGQGSAFTLDLTGKLRQ